LQKPMQRRFFIAAAGATGATLVLPAWAHHGWSSFDQTRPLFLDGRVTQVAWRNPHVELTLELAQPLKLPADLASRTLPPQAAAVDGPALLKAVQLPTRKDCRWAIELAPLTRVQAWGVPEIKPGDSLAVLGFTFSGEQGDAVLRAEYLFAGGKAYGLRSAPA
jgi:Family of unknown function (DUF6152)